MGLGRRTQPTATRRLNRIPKVKPSETWYPHIAHVGLAFQTFALTFAEGMAFAQVGLAARAGGWSTATTALASGMVGGIASVAGGGHFGPGFLAAGVGSLAGSLGSGQFNAGRMIASAVIGGVASVLGGGKFANGAITGAFAYAASASYSNDNEYGGSPTSQNITDPRSVDVTANEGPWGNVHFVGEASGVAQLEKDLLDLGTTNSMADVVSAAQASGRTLTIRADLINANSGWNYTVNIDVADTVTVTVMTAQGPQQQAVPSIIKLGHELPHAILGTQDNGPGQMNNVNQYENPLRKELGYPSRIKY